MRAAQLDMLPETRIDTGGELENDRYTLPETVDYCRRVASKVLRRPVAYTLDVAACTEAHCAPEYYSLRDGRDGLALPWFGDVWCNPPYDDLDAWVRKAWGELRRCKGSMLVISSISMLPPGDRMEQEWWQRWVKPFRDGRGIYLPGWELTLEELPGRQRFGHPGNPRGVGVTGAMFPNSLLLWSPV